MRKTVLATAVAAALTLSAAQASAQTKGTATKAEVQSIQAQMQALSERLNRLETTNAELKSQNSELQSLADRREAEMEYLKSQTKELREEGAVAANEISKVKGADWATKIKFKGDLRLRGEQIDQERVAAADVVEDAANRDRARIRARFGFDATVSDKVKASFLIATGADDPRSSNQTLGGSSTRKSVGLDLAYIDWAFMPGANLTAGKVKYPFFRPGQSLFYDGDYNPEGVAVAFDRGMLFGSAYGWVLEERANVNPARNNTDTVALGTQLGLKFPLLGGETRVAAHYYDLNGAEGQAPFYASNANGNSTVARTFAGSTTGTQVLAYDYTVLMGSAEMGTTLFDRPFTVWVDYAMNTASGVDEDTAYGVGATIGKASNAKTWEAGLFYQSIEKDALFAQMIDSDFGDGTTNADGWVLKAGYAPVRNITLNGTYFINSRTVCGTGSSPSNALCGTGIPEYDLDYNRLQLDVNYKF